MAKKEIIRKGFISELDYFLKKFDKEHPLYGQSRLEEIKKHQAIALKRDTVVVEDKPLIWEKFSD